MVDNIDNCPCSGKSMSNLAAPWILLTLFNHGGTHGYEIKKKIGSCMGDMHVDMNITGLYRHLNLLEKRGLLHSEWDTPQKGPPKRKYYLTEAGNECLWRWVGTLSQQMSLIDKFFDQIRMAFPSAILPRIREVRNTHELEDR